MSNLEKAKATSSNAQTAMRYYLDDRLVPVITRYKEKTKDIGSGTCIKIKGKYFIITAGHVISNYNLKDISLLLAGAGRPPYHVTKFINIGYNFDESNDIDVGYIEISEKEAKKLGKKFIEHDPFKFNVSHFNEDTVLVSGYPCELIKLDQTKDFNIYTVRASHFQTMTLPTDKWPKRFGVDKHILLNYQELVEDSDGNTVKIPDAPGISGGSIWAINAKTKGIWSPQNTNLIGIQSLWNQKERYLVGIQIQHWINLIKTNYDDLEFKS